MTTKFARPSVVLPSRLFKDRESYFDSEGFKHNSFLDGELGRRLGFLAGISGGARGIATAGDVVTQTTDGRDLRAIWDEFQELVRIRNARRDPLMNLLVAPVTEPIVDVPQFGAVDAFEIASEFGVPKAIRTSASTFAMGFPFEWYDARGAYTWKFLVDADARQVESITNAILEADNVLMFNEAMRVLFLPTNRTATIKKNAYNVYALYNADGTIPPDYKTNTFLGTHTHYLSSGAATVDSGDLDEMQLHLNHHGYTRARGSQLILMVNVAQGDTIRTFKSVQNGGTAKYDFIPSLGQPAFLQNVTQVQDPNTPRPPATFQGFDVLGSYGEFLILQEDYIPAPYMVAFATGGEDGLQNPLGLREHANPAYRGLRLVKGRDNDYPLQDAMWQRGFGVAVRQRGSAVVMRVGVAAYSAPTNFG